MKVLLEIKDNKVDFVMELLRSLPFVKTKAVDKKKEQILKDLEEAVSEVNRHKQGKAKLKTAQELFDEL